MLMVAEVRRILFFLTKNGFVNHGILRDVPKSLTVPKDKKVNNSYSVSTIFPHYQTTNSTFLSEPA